MSIAFFDIDGTLLPHPSLERRFFWNLFRAGKIPVGNYFRWAAEMFRHGGAEFSVAAQCNKTYLRGVWSGVISEMSRETRWVPEFFPAALQRVWWHALHGDTIVLVTGTLAPLAEIVKSALERELLLRGVETRISIIATQLTIQAGCWTGRVSGSPMFGEAKAAAIRGFAQARADSLQECAAYGDHLLDQFMLEAVGNRIAVNPTLGLRRVALRKGWLVAIWTSCPRRTPGARHALEWKGKQCNEYARTARSPAREHLISSADQFK
jgi:phosphoserine phosphatase